MFTLPSCIQHLQSPRLDLLHLIQAFAPVIDGVDLHGRGHRSEIQALVGRATHAHDHAPLPRAGEKYLERGLMFSPHFAPARLLLVGLGLKPPGSGIVRELGRAACGGPVPPGLAQFFAAAAALPSWALNQDSIRGRRT